MEPIVPSTARAMTGPKTSQDKAEALQGSVEPGQDWSDTQDLRGH